MGKQLALNLRLRDGSSFANFYAGSNREAFERTRALLEEPHADGGPRSFFLWGERASGKTHLLEAACRAVHARGAVALYLPLGGSAGLRPEMLEAADQAFLIALDDVQYVAGNHDWEAALFALYELSRASGARLVAAATAAPTHLGLAMPELATRFGWGPVYQLRALADADKLEAVRLRAHNRGLELSADVLRYILNRYPRDLASLFALLDRIDVAALASQRRVTIPFLRQLESR